MTNRKPIPGYPNYYVTDQGDVISYATKTPRKLQPFNKSDYHKVYVFNDGKRKCFNIHRLVAFAFVDNPHGYPCVNHKDGIRCNNAASNLDWVTHQMNTRHAVATGLTSAKGATHYKAKPPSVYKQILGQPKTDSAAVVAARFGVSKYTVRSLRKGTHWHVRSN